MTIALITHADCLLHDPGKGHPECAARLQVIVDALVHAGLDSELVYEDAPLVSWEALRRVHDEDYINGLFQLAPPLGTLAIDADTIMNPYTIIAACRAAGSVVKAVDMVLGGQVNVAFCNVRPPGHHAEKRRAMGFCFFNNVAVGVAHSLEHHRLKRVAIIDFDVHRGNGTEDIFQDNKKVLMCSIHEEGLYPGESDAHHRNIINIPLPAGATGREFRAELIQYAFAEITRFKPELIFVSAGFDGHKLDSISSLNLTEVDYLWVTEKIKHIADNCCKGRIVSVLEGGYALDALGLSVVAHIKGLKK